MSDLACYCITIIIVLGMLINDYIRHSTSNVDVSTEE